MKLRLNEADPTRQAGNRKAATGKAATIVEEAGNWVEEWFNAIPADEQEDGTTRYQMPENPDEQQSLIEEALIAFLFLGGSFFMARNIEAAIRSGVLATEPDIKRDLGLLFGASSPEALFAIDNVFSSQGYTSTLNRFISETLASMKGVMKDEAQRIFVMMMKGMAAGLSRKAILEQVRGRLEKIKSKLNRIIRTQINQALNEGKMVAVEVTAKRFGTDAIVQHISALLPTTRAHHAARHKKFYTLQAQREWWATGANAINCYCSVRPVLRKKSSA